MSIREGKVALITCPDGSCPYFETKNNLIIAREIKLLVSNEYYETYKRFRLNWMIENDPTRTWCPTPNCETICYIRRTKTKNSNKPMSVFCSNVSYPSTVTQMYPNYWHIPEVQQNVLLFVSEELAFGHRLQETQRTGRVRHFWLQLSFGVLSTDLSHRVLLNENSPIKRCPKCFILIERDEGCAQIMCRNCKHVFCWYCLASLEVSHPCPQLTITD